MFEIKELTCGESLKIERAREKKTQVEKAKELGLSLSKYYRLENDIDSSDRKCLLASELTTNEKCIILRWRKNLTQQELADKLRVTRTWLNLVETGTVESKLVSSYWGMN